MLFLLLCKLSVTSQLLSLYFTEMVSVELVKDVDVFKTHVSL